MLFKHLLFTLPGLFLLGGLLIGCGNNDANISTEENQKAEAANNEVCKNLSKNNFRFYATQDWLAYPSVRMERGIKTPNCNKTPSDCFLHPDEPIRAIFVNVSHLLPQKTLIELVSTSQITTASGNADESTDTLSEEQIKAKENEQADALKKQLALCSDLVAKKVYYFPRYKKGDRLYYGFTLTINKEENSFNENSDSSFKEQALRRVEWDADSVLEFDFTPSDFKLKSWPAGNYSIKAEPIVNSDTCICPVGLTYSDCYENVDDCAREGKSLSTIFTMGSL